MKTAPNVSHRKSQACPPLFDGHGELANAFQRQLVLCGDFHDLCRDGDRGRVALF